MTNFNNKIAYDKIIKIIVFSGIYTAGLHYFMNPANLLTTGLAGISQIIEELTPISYGIIYIIINIPGIILGFTSLGKKFTIYSLFSILTVSFCSFLFSIIPVWETNNLDPLINAIFGGVLMGYGMGMLLKIGGSSGGTDFFGMYLLKYKNIDFQKVNLVINLFIIVIGFVFWGIELGLYTLVSLYVRTMALEYTFTNAQSVTLFIVGENLDKVSDYITCRLKRGTTIINDVEGGYTHKNKQMIMTTLNKYEYSVFIGEIFNIKGDLFINIMDTKQIVGNFQKDKGEVEEEDTEE